VATCNRRDAVTLAHEAAGSAGGPKPGRISFTPKLAARRQAICPVTRTLALVCNGDNIQPVLF